MAEKEAGGYISELDEEADGVDWKTPFKKASNWITRNRVINQIDFFSLDVKFLLKGQETFRTNFAGFVGILMYVAVALLAYYIAWPEQLTSRIVENQYNRDLEQTGQSIYENNDNPLTFELYDRFAANPTIPSEFEVKFFYVKESGDATLMAASKDCPAGGKYCLRDSSGENVQIYGTASKGSKIVAEVLWCNTTADANCTSIHEFLLGWKLKNYRQTKQIQLTPYFEEFVTYASDTGLYRYEAKVSKQIYTSNNKFLGHVSNLFPQTLYTYYYDPEFYNNLLSMLAVTYSDLQPTQVHGLSFQFMPSGVEAEYDEEFQDVAGAIVFFLALLDPVRMIINMVFVKWYNLNSRNLYIADKIYYVEDSQKHQKYDFKSGAAVFFTCLLHHHIVSILVQKLLASFGKNLVDVLPKKCIHTMAMIQKGESLLYQNNFFGALEELSALEDCPAKKIPFYVPEQEEEEQEQVEEADYFPESPTKRQAFVRFCSNNQIISASRKNNVYEVLREKKYTTTLKDLLHKEFNIQVRNVRRLAEKGTLNISLNEKEEWSNEEVPVEKAIEEQEDSAFEMKISVHEQLN